MMEQVDKVLLDAIKYRIENPTDGVVSSNASFVRYALSKEGYQDLAAAYWWWVCGFTGSDKDREKFGNEVFEAQVKLNSLTRFSMPDWGTSGT